MFKSILTFVKAAALGHLLVLGCDLRDALKRRGFRKQADFITFLVDDINRAFDHVGREDVRRRVAEVETTWGAARGVA